MQKINVKDLIVKAIPSKIANAYVKKHHYSGKVVNNSKVHFGVFYNGKLYGVLSYGPSTDKNKMIGLVKNTKWHDFIELNRMAFSDVLPKNSESRCIAITLKLLKKKNPELKWVISFADGTQCGDGTIYRASNFKLTQIKQNNGLRKNPKTGEVSHQLTEATHRGNKDFKNWEKVKGYQLRYIYFYDNYIEDYTGKILQFSEIDKIGARMYKGNKL